MKAIGVRAGRFALFIPALLKPRAAAMRALLWCIAHNVPTPPPPPPGLVSLPAGTEWPDGFAIALGWIDAGPSLIRLDVAERVAAELSWASRFRPIAMPGDLPSRLSIRAEHLPAVMRRLGFRVLPAATLDDATYGPPAPPMLAQARRRPPDTLPPPPRQVANRDHGPFAALAALRR